MLRIENVGARCFPSTFETLPFCESLCENLAHPYSDLLSFGMKRKKRKSKVVMLSPLSVAVWRKYSPANGRGVEVNKVRAL